ncbi:ATP-binding cassette domain-containing protein [Cellulomonas hominis]|uniref:ATP-binding cassette domain-containing protein n=1 Tax=Cellulomonas hominis TaxID=156981 RepID=UPI001B8F8F31|nr:ATP-binding cassette domain-containing protein [Cellulomonas hominis]VTR76180.1 Trehalose import ATP-binding protein SugC [Cellulomonas hominis]
MAPGPRPGPAARIAALPRLWVVLLLAVGALNLAVVSSAPAHGLEGLRPADLAPLVAALPDPVLVADGSLVAAATTRSDAHHAVVVDPTTTVADAQPPAGTSAVVLAGDGLALLSGGDRWTVPYAGSLHASELGALLAGWEQAQRGPTLAFAVMSGVLAATLATAVLTFGMRLAAPPGRAGAPRSPAVIRWWSVCLAGASTVAATSVSLTDRGGQGDHAATLAVDDVSLSIDDREFVVLIGPSGCGKSTLLRMLAGLEDVTAGDVLVDGRRMNDVHPKNRDVSMVFQNYALYPHMSVAQNISFGLRLRRTPRAVVQQKVGAVADALGLTPYLDRPPAELSGGQRQRVALARAMVQDSRIFLMDEPLSNLDAKLRSTMRAEILDLHRSLGVTTVYVTHDQVEAMTMADRVVLLRDGVVVQQGPPRELYRNPVDRFVATFLGDPEINLLPAVRDHAGLDVPGARVPWGWLPAGSAAAAAGSRLSLGVRPEHLRVGGHDESGRGVEDASLDAELVLLELRGDDAFATFRAGDRTLVAKVPAETPLRPGDRTTLRLDTARVHVFDDTTGVTLPG